MTAVVRLVTERTVYTPNPVTSIWLLALNPVVDANDAETLELKDGMANPLPLTVVIDIPLDGELTVQETVCSPDGNVTLKMKVNPDMLTG